MIAVQRLTFDVAGERVVMAPITTASIDAIRTVLDRVGALDALVLFATLIEEPADAVERDALWIGAALNAWQAQVSTLTGVPDRRGDLRRACIAARSQLT